MTDPASPNPAPGWYADPWGAATLRYWDGTQWTADTATPPGADGPLVPTGAYTEEAGTRAAKYGRIGITLGVLVNPIVLIVYGALLAFVISFAMAHSNTTSNQADDTILLVIIITLVVALPIILILSYTALGFLMAWSYRINENARDLAIRTKFSSILACLCWLIPYANIVMPYFGVRGAVPAEDDRSPYLKWWLTRQLLPLAGIIGIGLALVGAAIDPIGAVVGSVLNAGVAVAIACIDYHYGIRVVRLIRNRHDEIAAAISAT